MKMDGRDRVECQNWEKRDVNVILEKFKSLKDKTWHSVFSFIKPKKKKRREQNFEIH